MNHDYMFQLKSAIIKSILHIYQIQHAVNTTHLNIMNTFKCYELEICLEYT